MLMEEENAARLLITRLTTNTTLVGEHCRWTTAADTGVVAGWALTNYCKPTAKGLTPGHNGVGIARWLQRQTRDWKVTGLSPCRCGRREFSSRRLTFSANSYFGSGWTALSQFFQVNSCTDLFVSAHSTFMSTAHTKLFVHVKDPTCSPQSGGMEMLPGTQHNANGWC